MSKALQYLLAWLLMFWLLWKDRRRGDEDVVTYDPAA